MRQNRPCRPVGIAPQVRNGVDPWGAAADTPPKSSKHLATHIYRRQAVLDLTAQVNLLADRAHAHSVLRPRSLIAIAGAPGCGKSTLAAELSRRLTDQRCANAIVPLDGFLLDNRVLDDRGLLTRKGAPESFDAAGFLTLINRLRQPQPVVFPLFDRDRDLSIAGAGVVPADCPIVIVEGTYLLFAEDPWAELAPAWDISVRLHVPEPELRARMIQRWLRQNHTRAAATRRAEANDLPNARRLAQAALPAQIDL